MKVYSVSDYARASTSEFSVVSADSEEEAIAKHNHGLGGNYEHDVVRTTEIVEYTENNDVRAQLLSEESADHWDKYSFIDGVIEDIETELMAYIVQKLKAIEALEALRSQRPTDESSQ